MLSRIAESSGWNVLLRPGASREFERLLRNTEDRDDGAGAAPARVDRRGRDGMHAEGDEAAEALRRHSDL